MIREISVSADLEFFFSCIVWLHIFLSDHLNLKTKILIWQFLGFCIQSNKIYIRYNGFCLMLEVLLDTLKRYVYCKVNKEEKDNFKPKLSMHRHKIYAYYNNYS